MSSVSRLSSDESYLFKSLLVFLGLLSFGVLSTLPLYWLAYTERSVYLENAALEIAQRQGLTTSDTNEEEDEPRSTFIGQLKRRKSGERNWLIQKQESR